MILEDTSVWTDFLNSNRGPAEDELESLIRANAPLVLAGVIVTEVLQGLKHDVAPATRLLAGWPLIEPDGFATYRVAASVFRQARARGLAISTVNVLLAALAIEYQAAWFTPGKDFERLTFLGLRLHGANQDRV